MAKKTYKTCNFCGEEFASDDKSVVLFKSTTTGESFRICNNCVNKCHELYISKMQQEKQKEIGMNPIDMTPVEIKTKLDEWVLDQDIATKKIAREYYNHLKRLKRYDMYPDADKDLRVDKSNMIYLGPTGVGKTHIIRALASFMDLPYVIEDVTNITSSGYVGRDATDILKDLYEAADGDIERAQKGIVFLDEFDKLKKTSGGRNGKDVSGEGTQQALLRLIEGGTHKVPTNKQSSATIDFNTDNVLFIAGGAFVGIEKIIANRLNKENQTSKVGFGATLEKDQEQMYNELITQVKPEDLIEFGLINECMGRLPVIVPFKELSIETLRNILTEPKHAIVEQFKEMYKFESDVELNFTEEALLEIAARAKAKKIGARGLRSVIEEVLDEVGYLYPTEVEKGLEKVLIKDDLSYEFVYGEEEELAESESE